MLIVASVSLNSLAIWLLAPYLSPFDHGLAVKVVLSVVFGSAFFQLGNVISLLQKVRIMLDLVIEYL